MKIHRIMKTILHLAISADGFIAKIDGNSDWVASADEILFKNRVREAGCLVVGRTTFDQYQGSIYPVDGAINIVLTRNPDPKITDVLFADSPMTTVALAKENECSGIVIAGGGRTSAAFLEANLIDEIFFSVHPFVFGNGIRAFEGMNFEKRLELIDLRTLEDGLVELHYQVLR